jgi:hypothetical protein
MWDARKDQIWNDEILPLVRKKFPELQEEAGELSGAVKELSSLLKKFNKKLEALAQPKKKTKK